MGVSDKNFYHGFLRDIDPQPQKPIEGEEGDAAAYPRLHPKQVPGKYWIDGYTCMVCDACTMESPNNIRLEDDEKNHTSYVYRQPETPEEEAAMRQAMNCCPVEAIMDTGTENVR
jgi:ferredoxin